MSNKVIKRGRDMRILRFRFGTVLQLQKKTFFSHDMRHDTHRKISSDFLKELKIKLGFKCDFSKKSRHTSKNNNNNNKQWAYFSQLQSISIFHLPCQRHLCIVSEKRNCAPICESALILKTLLAFLSNTSVDTAPVN